MFACSIPPADGILQFLFVQSGGPLAYALWIRYHRSWGFG